MRIYPDRSKWHFFLHKRYNESLGGNDDDALWNALLLQVTLEEHTIVAASIIVGRDRDTIDLRISWQNLKAHACMKGNGACIHRRSNSAYFGTSHLSHHLKEVLVEATANALPTAGWMDADKVDLCQSRGCLRPETHQKPHNLFMLLDHKAGGLKRLKKEPVKHPCHGAVYPPVIDDLDNRGVILDLYMSQDTDDFCSSAKEKEAVSL